MGSQNTINSDSATVKPDTQFDWQLQASSWAYANQKPTSKGVLKAKPEDFVVDEIIDIEFAGQGEHVWLNIEKQSLNTVDLVRALSDFAGIKQKDVGYSGMKDKHAVTRQWFSLCKTGIPELDFSSFELPNARLLSVEQHDRKLRLATHRYNQFEIVISDLDLSEADLHRRIECIQQNGVPNYFGPQRFGNGMLNLKRSLDYFSSGESIRDKRLRGLLYSSMRSWLFNCMLHNRVEQNNWNRLVNGEAVILNGSKSYFFCDKSSDEQLESRIESLDIHPAQPMYGADMNEQWSKMRQTKGSDGDARNIESLIQMQASVIGQYEVFSKALNASGMKADYRPLRIKVERLSYELADDKLVLKFRLLPGQFATSVIRELVNV